MRTSTMRRTLFLGATATLVAAALAAVTTWYWSAPSVLRVAVGPAGSDDVKLIAAAAQYLGREHETVRFKIVPATDESDAAAQLEAGDADLAVVRSDIAIPARGQTVAVMHRDIVVGFALAHSGIDKLDELRGRKVALVGRVEANKRLLGVILAHMDIPPVSVTTLPLEEPRDATAALRDGTVDAVLAVGTPNGRTVTDTLMAVAAAADGTAPVILPVPDAEAIADRSPVYEATDIVRGAFGGVVPRPPETLKTLGVTHRLVAATSLNADTVAELTRLLFAMRPAIAAEVPLANRIVAPDHDKDASLPVHPGASAYYEGEVQSFLERNSDTIHIGAMVLSVLGSGAAAIASRAGSRKRSNTLQALERLLAIVAEVRTAPDGEVLRALEDEADAIVVTAIHNAAQGLMDATGLAAFSLAMDQVRAAAADRRARFGSGIRVPLRAAE